MTIVLDHVVQQRDVASRSRFVDEADALLSRLEEHLSAALLQEVRPLDAYPHGNQVIMNRDGYRDLFRLYLASHVAASLSWQGRDEIYGAGQKNVAVLYEYWMYVQLAQLLAQLTGQSLRLASLVRTTEYGLSVGLERGRHQKKPA